MSLRATATTVVIHTRNSLQGNLWDYFEKIPMARAQDFFVCVVRPTSLEMDITSMKQPQYTSIYINKMKLWQRAVDRMEDEILKLQTETAWLLLEFHRTALLICGVLLARWS